MRARRSVPHVLVPLARYAYRTRFPNPYLPANDRLRSIFIHIPKNGGISVENALFGSKVGHKTLRQFEAHDADRYRRYFKFSIVRNPYDRLVSAFHFLRHGGRNLRDRAWAEANLCNTQTFAEFLHQLSEPRFAASVLRWQHFQPQYQFVTNFEGALALDFVARFEQIDAQFGQIAIHLGRSDIQLPHDNRSPRADWRSYYNEQSLKQVGELYATDFEMLGYSRTGT